MSCASFSAPFWSGQGAQVEKGLRQTPKTYISNRHPGRLETHVNPCASITSLFLIVTRKGVNLLAFSSHFSARQSSLQRQASSFQNASPRLLCRPSGCSAIGNLEQNGRLKRLMPLSLSSSFDTA